MNAELTDRQRRILARLVTEYIDQGAPVSSAWLAEHSALGLSSATVRNILARLEEQGLVWQPHTSAGRVPTDSGYRMYVDFLLGARRRGRVPAEVEARLLRAGTVGDVLENASQEVSRASQQIGFVMAPADQSVRLEHIDFVNLDGCRVLVVVVATGGQITHKVIETEGRLDATLLAQAASYVNLQFTGLSLHEARTAIAAEMRQERMLYDALMARALQLARSGLAEVMPAETLHVEILTEYLAAPGLTVVIGAEHGEPDLKAFSVVASTFRDGARTGTIGVIGPTRMRYQRAIAVVDGVSRAMSRALDRS
jgi:heat-inducible transcriptional repressor